MNDKVHTNNLLFARVAELVAKAGDVPLEKVTSDSSFQSLGFDSLDAVALISDLEEEFNVKIPNQELLNIKTMGQVIESLQKRIL